MSQRSQKQGGMVLILLVVALLFAFLIPSIFGFTSDESSVTRLFQENQTTTISYSLEAELTNVNTTDKDISIRLIDSQTRVYEQVTDLPEGNNKTVTLNNNQITVHNHNTSVAKEARIQINYPTYYKWPKGAKVLIQNLNLILLAIFILIVIMIAFYGLGDNQ